jgi:hypothetical protein
MIGAPPPPPTKAGAGSGIGTGIGAPWLAIVTVVVQALAAPPARTIRRTLPPPATERRTTRFVTL